MNIQIIGIAVLIGFFCGWHIHKAYLRSLAKTLKSIRKQMRGGR